MTTTKLTVLKGGLSSDINDGPKRFVSAYATNTRLMGVLAVYAGWYIASPGPASRESGGYLHQFFYIDCEEAGLETYTSHYGNNTSEIEATEQALIGGLGADKFELDERMFRALMCKYREFNRQRELDLPDGLDEYGFIFEPETRLGEDEQKRLMDGLCGDIVSDFQVVNYFLMRCFGRDYEGARHLTRVRREAGPLDDDFPLNIYDRYFQATFCKNVIDTGTKYADGSISYICESLIEMDGEYDSIISKVVVRDLRVIGFEFCSGFRVSSAEAAMMLVKPEFLTVYEIMLSDEEIGDNIGEFTVGLNTIMSTHENGSLFMAFRQNNDHVNSRVFMLNNDVKGMYYLTDFGQLIAAAYSRREIRKLEETLNASPLSPCLVPTARYEFKEPLLFEFMNSDFEDFEDFLDFLDE